jgi:ankyrin repeat protein
MTTLKRIIIVFLVLIFLSPCVKAQQDSVVLDSIVTRLRVLLEEYNEEALIIDTSRFITEGYDTDDDINLQIAASMGACLEIITLYARGADVNNFVGSVATPLHYAVSSGSMKAVEILLLLGALPDKPDQYGYSPLIAAVMADNLEIAELLIRYGASITKADRNGSSPLHHAAALGFFYTTDMLLYYDAPVEMYDYEGNTPLMLGVSFSYYDITDILLRAGADPNTKDKKGFTPLMAAAQNGDTLMLRMLINAGANLYSANDDNYDALGCAARFGQLEAASFLLQNGNRWNYKNNGVKNPVDIAEYYSQSKLLPLLTLYGLAEEPKFALEELTFSAGARFTSHYLLMDGSLSLTEPRMKAGITLGAATNPFGWKLLVKENDATWQYMVNTYLIYAGVFKEFELGETADGNKLSIIPSLSAGYRFYSNYEGVERKPESKFCIIPSADISWKLKYFGMSAGLSYMQTPFLKVFPIWLNLKLSYTLLQKSPIVPGKKIKIYNYEK